MAKNRIPNPLERRHLVEKDLPAPQALAIAEAYLADGRSEEAVDFLRLAGEDERLGAAARDGGGAEEGPSLGLRVNSRAIGGGGGAAFGGGGVAFGGGGGAACGGGAGCSSVSSSL